jgi:urocanate hydratase
MTHTVQPCSWATLSNAEKDLNQTDDNKILLLSVFDNMNKLIETANKLNYMLQRKQLERILYQEDKNKGEEK